MNSTKDFDSYFKTLQDGNSPAEISKFRDKGFEHFRKLGIPGPKHEEWKYTRIATLFNHEYSVAASSSIDPSDLDRPRLPGYENANELFFLNGRFMPELSVLRSPELEVLELEKAAGGEYAQIVNEQLGHSSKYLNDGINALNNAFVHGGLFVFLKKGKVCSHPVYVYNVTDARSANVLSQPRSLFYISERAEIKILESYTTLGTGESFTNQVMEIVVDTDARVEYYKLQQDVAHANQVSTTHIRQIGKSFTHAVTISLTGGVLRNNLNMVMEAPFCESHLYGLYFPTTNTHIDNHSVVDNVAPNCFSNELYKGILGGNSTAVFNGKIFVRQPAQKTNAFQSNKNVLLSSSATVNTKPQLEIFADDVKCSHGCTIGQLDEAGIFYLRSRGIPENIARSLLVQSFADDVIEQIKLEPVRNYVAALVAAQLK